MNGRRAAAVRRRLHANDSGFTLIELLLVVVILGIIAAPLANVVTSFFINSATTTARLSGSHDEQLAAAYFSQDVANLGIRDQSSLVAGQSVWTGSFPAGSCGAGIGTPVVLLAWDDVAWTGSAAQGTIDEAAYVVQTVSGETQLHRLFCTGPSLTSQTLASDAVIAHNIVTPAPTVACAGTGCPSAGPTVPASITLTLNLRASDPGNRGGTLQVSLTGQRRQT